MAEAAVKNGKEKKEITPEQQMTKAVRYTYKRSREMADTFKSWLAGEISEERLLKKASLVYDELTDGLNLVVSIRKAQGK